ncbi:uncharacterized protein ACRADG_011134 [Cochliomyia hominivorax]
MAQDLMKRKLKIQKFVCGQSNYELVFFDEEIFSPCEKYPNNFLDQVFDLSTLRIEQNEDYMLMANGYVTILTTIKEPFPVTVEVFKKKRGTWQPTFYSQMRNDTCTALFSKTELWHSYFENVPDEQRTCPFTKGINCQVDYEFEFLEERIFSPCENYPDNSIDSLIDMSNINIEQTEDGSLVVKGYSIIKITSEDVLPLSVEVFKKERGTWQPTIYTQKRPDTCTASFGETELWHSYLKNTPEDQLKCPFTEGQRLDFDISEPTIMSLPVKNGEGEYKIHATAGSEDDDHFVCVDIFVMVHQM